MSVAAETLGLVNPAAEMEVLAGMMSNETVALNMAQQLVDTAFYDPRRRVIFGALRRLVMGIEPINDDTILAECRAVALRRP